MRGIDIILILLILLIFVIAFTILNVVIIHEMEKNMKSLKRKDEYFIYLLTMD